MQGQIQGKIYKEFKKYSKLKCFTNKKVEKNKLITHLVESNKMTTGI